MYEQTQAGGSWVGQGNDNSENRSWCPKEQEKFSVGCLPAVCCARLDFCGACACVEGVGAAHVDNLDFAAALAVHHVFLLNVQVDHVVCVKVTWL